MSNHTTAETALALLRQKMQDKQLDYYLVGSTDPHSNEYVPAHWQYLAEVSGFTGSLGYLLVSQNFAGLWVDSRYHIQAERECPDSIRIFHVGNPGVPPLHEYWQQCLTAATKQTCLGFDGSCFSHSSLNRLLSISASLGGLIDGESLCLGELWLPETEQGTRLARPDSPVCSYKPEYAGQGRKEKVQQVRELMATTGSDYYPIPLLDNIAWLLNIRADDIPYNPVAISYLILGQQSVCWYIGEHRISGELVAELRSDIPELEIKPYGEFYRDCRLLARQQPPARFLLTQRCNMMILGILLRGGGEPETHKPSQRKLMQPLSGPLFRDIITDLKTIKNPTEQEQLRKIMAIDGAAIVAFHSWLRPRPNRQNGTSPARQNIDLQDREFDEYQIGQKVIEFRCQIAGERGRGESFAPIVGFCDNSALPHYSAAAEGSHTIRRSGGWMLIDSGGQYLGGTTDMTRCFSLEADFAAPRFESGAPSEDLRKIYTLVLRGHLLLQNSRFPQGTLGIQLDTLARSFLWSERLDYRHGTGHGVGSFLNVHEGPASISPSPLNELLKAGMLISNEPGYYREGAFGIRIENLMLVQVDEQDPNWLCFEPVTVFPYERELICLEQMTPQEKLWVNRYHANCLQRVLRSGKLNEEQENWLRWRCAPLEIS
ncbi:M24 family metallopeptidase [Candidatus Haliotispira prima]|uniref:M24 family metallopeptidase n=1 Tax=Candidatus Haliotispira prima TaxID=3034016 RepID=A0ABY8MGI3_9SPIO|nr:M24 family metallopeptidase [Candidatus Haliotispira prima]